MAVSGEMFLEWIMDSGGSYNMTPKRGFLFDFKEFNSGTVLLSDNRACAIKGPGKVRVHMKDDSSFVIENVRYILEFKKNLISLGILNREGYTVNLQNGRVNVIKEFNKLCKESGITRNLKVVGTPQQSSLAGQMNRTLLNKVSIFIVGEEYTCVFMVGTSGELRDVEDIWLRCSFKEKVEFEVKLLGNRVEPIMNRHTWENPGYEDKGQNEEYARPQQRNLENYVLCVIELREQLLHLQGIGMECGIVYTKGLLQKEFDMKELCPTMKILGLVYGRDLGNHMDAGGFVDSYFSNNPDKGRSITGYVFIVHGCVVSWKATLQHVVALSTTEVMYMTLTKAVKESIWLKGLLIELRVNLRSMVVNYDNQGAIHL
ncbi:retrovirus-related pol polyprotein from transposon TNT 1-94 [Tanacetum coccineum]